MNPFPIALILVSILLFQSFGSIDANVANFFEKVKQEVRDVVEDSDDYGPKDEFFGESIVKPKYLDYYVPSKRTIPRTSTTTTPRTESREPKVAAGAEKKVEESGGRSTGAVVIIVIVVVVLIVLLGAGIGIFFIVRQNKSKPVNLRRRPLKRESLKSLASIQTVDENTGKEIVKPKLVSKTVKSIAKK